MNKLLVFDYYKVSGCAVSNIINNNKRVFVTSFNASKLLAISHTGIERFWFLKQNRQTALASSKFSCIPGQIKMAPPLGPLLAQFLSGLASEFITFLSGIVDSFQKSLMSTQEINLDSLSVKLYKFKTDELKLSLSFSVIHQLFQTDLLHEVVESWRNGFNLLDKIMFNNETESDIEQARLVLKNSLKLEMQGFQLLNLYLLLCSWFVDEFCIKNEQARDFLIFNKKSVNSWLPLFNAHNSLVPFEGLNYGIFVQLFRSVTVVYKGLSLCFNQKRGRVLMGRKRR